MSHAVSPFCSTFSVIAPFPKPAVSLHVMLSTRFSGRVKFTAGVPAVQCVVIEARRTDEQTEAIKRRRSSDADR